MATINGLLSRLRVKLRDNSKAASSAASAHAAGSTTLKVADNTDLKDGDYIEIGSEAIFIEQGEKLVDYLDETSNLAAATTSVAVETSANFLANDFIRVNEEYMKIAKVSAISGKNLKVTRGVRGTEAVEHYQRDPIYMRNQAKVRRGVQGSTAAAITNGAALYISDGWTDFELREHLKEGVRELRPEFYLDWIGNVRGVGNKRLIEDAEAAGWTQSSQGTAETLDTADKIEGTSSLNLGSSGSGTAVYDIALTSFDFTNYEYLVVGLKIADIFDNNKDPYFNEEAIEIRLGNDSSANYYSWKVHRNELDTGNWFYLVLHRSDATSTGTIDDSAIDVLQFRFSTAQAITTGNIKADNIFVSKFPVTTNKRVYALPRNVFGVNEVVAVNEHGDQKRTLTSWRVEGEAGQSYLIFDYNPPRNCYLEIKGRQLVKVPSDSTTEIGLDDTEEEAVVLKAALKALDTLMTDRLRFDKYADRVEKTGSGVLDVYRAKQRLQSDFDALKLQLGKSPGAVDLDWTDESSHAKNTEDQDGAF